MRSVGAFEAKTHLAALLDAVAAGEQITITRHGRPVASLVPPADRPGASCAIKAGHDIPGQTLRCGRSGAGCVAQLRLEFAEAHVPSLWLWETGNVLVQAEGRRRITAAAIHSFLGLLEGLPIRIDHAGITTIWHDTLALARTHRLTSYDAAYLELALRLGLPLASRDQALQAAATSEGVPLLPT